MKCFHPMCTATAPKSALFRVNAKGQTGVWACRAHIRNTDAKVDPDVDLLVRAIENRQVPK